MSEPKPRPPARNKRLSVPLDDDTYSGAIHAAKGSPRLVAMLRSWLRKFAAEEVGPLASEDEIQDEMRRAQKVARKKRKS